jgi:hypothetical protein
VVYRESHSDFLFLFLGRFVKRITNGKTGLKNKFGMKRCGTSPAIFHTPFGRIEGRKLIPFVLSLNL